MGLKPDNWISKMAAEYGMIEPFVENQVREGVISYGLSSYGYDARLSSEFRIFTNVFSALVDPKKMDNRSMIEHNGDFCVIPPNSFALARTVERFRIPRNVLVVCPLRINLQCNALGTRMGRVCHPGAFQHHSPAGEGLRQRRDCPIPVL